MFKVGKVISAIPMLSVSAIVWTTSLIFAIVAYQGVSRAWGAVNRTHRTIFDSYATNAILQNPFRGLRLDDGTIKLAVFITCIICLIAFVRIALSKNWWEVFARWIININGAIAVYILSNSIIMYLGNERNNLIMFFLVGSGIVIVIRIFVGFLISKSNESIEKKVVAEEEL